MQVQSSSDLSGGDRSNRTGDRLLVAFTILAALAWIAILVYSIWSQSAH
jgi:hypothetical protein